MVRHSLLALSIVLIAAIMLSMLWWLSSSLLLNSQWAADRLSQIEGVEVQWQRASSRHPGRWEVEGLTLTRQDPTLPVSISAERATLSLSLLSLLTGKLHIHALDAEGIRRFRVGDVALTAEGTLRLVDTAFSGDTLSAGELTLAVANGQLTRLRDSATLARDVRLDARATLAPTATSAQEPAMLAEALLDALTAKLDASARADAWDVFMPYLEALPGVSLAGNGALTVALGIERGVLTHESEVALRAPALRLGLDTATLLRTPQPEALAEHSATGSGLVRLNVDDDALNFRAALEDVVLADQTPYADQASFTATATTANQRLDQLAPPRGAEIALEGRVRRLDMLDRYASPAAPAPLAFEGQGRISARAEIQDAALYRAALDVEADGLSATYNAFTARGNGVLRASNEPGALVESSLSLSSATLTHQDRTLLADADITLALESPLEAPTLDEISARLTWQNATMPDIAALSPYLAAALPSPQALELESGQARSQGQLSLADNRLQGELSLVGERWGTRLPGDDQPRRLESDARLTLSLQDAALDGSAFDLSGSRLRWQVASATASTEALESELVLRLGRFQRRDGELGGQVRLEGEVQRLGFLNAFLPAGPGLAVDGSGELFLETAFSGSDLLPPTRLRVDANNLEAHFLDYTAFGRGELRAELSSRDDASLTLAIPRFELTRQGGERPALAGRHLALTTQTAHFRDVRETPSPEQFTTRIQLPIVEVPDIARYNDYLPDTEGLELLGGQASLESEWRLDGYRAEGEVTLRAFRTELALLKQRLRGDLTLHLALDEGDWQTRRFRARDSRLTLENVFRLSDQGAQDAGWWVRLELVDAALTWAEPIELSSSLRLSMRDTGLLARLFLARARSNEWLGRLLSVHGIEGRANVAISGERIHLHDLALGGGPLSLLSDITLGEQGVSGALYARLGALGLGVELIDGEPSLHLLQPRRWFDGWRATRAPRW
ncbi:hypothetical protein ACGK9R_07965 [Halomonas sp. HNIBRBA4712]|uniref:hypothetical protein n=1 Tax=Halomonas sp. HNIBRBA4712 TaxID=3373087 RepID=UPI003746F82D